MYRKKKMSLEDFNAYEETAHPRSSLSNTKRLRRAIRQLEAGKGKARKLIR